MKRINIITGSLITSLLLLSACNSHKSKTKDPEYKAPYTIGAQRLIFSDDKATSKISPQVRDILKLKDGDHRELMVKIWYPALPKQNEGNRHDYGFHTAEQQYPVDPASEIYQYMRNLYQTIAKPSQTYYDANPIENTAYPVIIDSHGYGIAIEAYQTYYESLTKQGYVVVAIAHTQESPYVTVNNNVGIGFNEVMEEDVDRLLPTEDWSTSQLLTDIEKEKLNKIPLGYDVDIELLKKSHYPSLIQIGSQDHLNLWVEDTKFVLSQLELINNGKIDSNLKGIFDLTKIAASGHSFGGATARRFCNQENNCLASINMDGSSFALFDEKIVNPHINFISDFEANIQEEIREGTQHTEEEIAASIKEQSSSFHIASHETIYAAQSDLYILQLKTISHSGFAAGWASLHEYGLGADVLQPIIEETSLQFFNQHLKSKQNPDAKQKLCQQITQHDALVSAYNNACQ